jgi:hypothetical protein
VAERSGTYPAIQGRHEFAGSSVALCSIPPTWSAHHTRYGGSDSVHYRPPDVSGTQTVAEGTCQLQESSSVMELVLDYGDGRHAAHAGNLLVLGSLKLYRRPITNSITTETLAAIPTRPSGFEF